MRIRARISRKKVTNDNPDVNRLRSQASIQTDHNCVINKTEHYYVLIFISTVFHENLEVKKVQMLTVYTLYTETKPYYSIISTKLRNLN